MSNKESSIPKSPSQRRPTLEMRVAPCPGEDQELPLEAGGRAVYVNIEPPVVYKGRPERFCKNKIKTSKYTAINFIPRTLLEQFRRLANVYFLFIGCLQATPAITTTNGVPTIALPLLFVLFVSAVKELIEDCRRHRKDDETNNRSTLRWSPQKRAWESVLWKHVNVHDIVKVENGEEFAADMVLLECSDQDEGVSFVQTMNLDGETNLKRRTALAATRAACSAAGVASLEAVVHAEAPSKVMHSFHGNLSMAGEPTRALTVDNLLMRGARLMNTEWAVGVVVYTGDESRIMMNAGAAPSKMSRVERITNKLLGGVFLLQAVLCFTQALRCGLWHAAHDTGSWYLELDSSASEDGIKRYFTYMILLTQLIPISLYVTVEIVKFLQMFLMQTDLQMYYAETDKPMECRTSNLNEELGMIRYVFSDKTGTLTQNCMDLACVWVGGVSYKGAVPGSTVPVLPHTKLRDDRILTALAQRCQATTRLVHMMAACNTVVPTHTEDGTLKFEAESPDELAFVWGAKSFGVELSARQTLKEPAECKQVLLNQGEQVYELLYTMEFSSDRARMSAVVRDNTTGLLQLWCKGADSKILKLLDTDSERNQKLLPGVLAAAEEYANMGLRTLCWAYAELPEAWFKQWRVRMDAALSAISDRDTKIAESAAEIETNLTLVGVTAVEDLLQTGVPETIAALRGPAGIKVWVLTGDKQGTAIQIAQQCNLVAPHVALIKVNVPLELLEKGSAGLEQQKQVLREVVQRGIADNVAGGASLVVDGRSLQLMLDDHELWMEFQVLAVECSSVIVCRVSPDQKAQVCNRVTMYHPERPRCLSIGDGANDVPMIQAAHVGVGIAGVEGMQAVQNSDYAIAQFQYLGRLLLVHGRWAYIRVTMVICYSFYKNMAFVLAQYWWGFQAGSSGQKFFTEVGYQMFNVLFTSLPVIVYGIWEQDASSELSMQHPELYHSGQVDELFNKKTFTRWVVNAIWHSLVLSLVPTYALQTLVIEDGRTLGGVWQLGNVVFTCVIIVVNLRLAFEVRYWIWVHWFVFSGMVLAWFAFDFVISAVTFPKLSQGTADHGLASMLFAQPVVWLVVLLTVGLAMLPDLIWIVWWFTRGLQGGLAQRLRQQAVLDGSEPAGCHCGCCCLCGDGCADKSRWEPTVVEEPVEESLWWAPKMGTSVDELIEIPHVDELAQTPRWLSESAQN